MMKRERLWGARLSFGALLLVFSEWIVWQRPLEYGAPEWLALGGIYLALAAIALDLIARLRVNDVFSLLLVAGLYGLTNATLISHVTTRDLPLSLIVRPLGAQPLAFMGALAAFRLLAGGRTTGPLEILVAPIAGLVWGVWVRWFPVVSEEPVSAARIETALVALAVGLLACGLIAALLPPPPIRHRDDWRLRPVEWLPAGGVLLVTLIMGTAQGHLNEDGLIIVLALAGFMLTVLLITAAPRRSSLLDSLTPRRPHLVTWPILIVLFLLSGWIGYRLPGNGDSSTQSDLVIGALTGFGLLWLPAVSTAIGIRAFVQLAREEA